MKVAEPRLTTTVAVTALLATSVPSIAVEYGSRWALVSDAYASVDRIIGSGDTENVLATLDNELTTYWTKCNEVEPKRQRAACKEDVRRLLSIAQFMADPDDPNRNPNFPTNIPDFVSPEMREIMLNWTPNWLTESWQG